MRRRRLAAIGLSVLLAVGAALAAPTSSLSTAEGAELYTVQAVKSDSLVESYGVGVHMAWLDTPYRDSTAVANRLSELGVRHVRDDLYLANPLQYAAMQTVANRGIKFNLIMGRPVAGLLSPVIAQTYVDTVANVVPDGIVESLEGPNEPDLWQSQNWATEAREYQQALYAAANANAETAPMPMLSPALAFRWNYPALGDVSSMADVANAHMYPGGYLPSNEITRITQALRGSMPTGPLITTEAGYHNALSTTNAHRPVPEDVAGVYVPRILLEHFSRGEQRVYSYELIDSRQSLDGTNPEGHFGLLHQDLSPKPAFTAMKNLLDLVEDPGPDFTPQPLQFRIDGYPSDARYVLTQKRTGEHVLLLWRDVATWNPDTQQPVAVTPTDVTLNLGKTSLMTVNRPSTGASPTSTTLGSTLPLKLDAQVTAITIDDPDVLPAPANVTASAGNASAGVAWTAPSDPRVTGFEVTRTPAGTTRTFARGTTSFADTGLINGTSYTYSIRSTGPTGWSAWVSSPPVVPATVPTAPTISSAVCNNKKLTVNWAAADPRGRAIDSYQASTSGQSKTLGASVRSTSFDKITKNSGVPVTVRAHNAVGWGPWSSKNCT